MSDGGAFTDLIAGHRVETIKIKSVAHPKACHLKFPELHLVAYMGSATEQPLPSVEIGIVKVTRSDVAPVPILGQSYVLDRTQVDGTVEVHLSAAHADCVQIMLSNEITRYERIYRTIGKVPRHARNARKKYENDELTRVCMLADG